MTRNETPPDQNGGSGQWLKSNLSALGSATVFAVYAAGFVRTKAAAASLSAEPVRRVQAATLAPPSQVSEPAMPTVSSSAPSVAPSKTPAADTVAAVAKPVEKAVPTAATLPPAKTPAKAPASTVATVATSTPVTAAATPAPSVPPATVAAPTAAPIKAAPVTPVPAPIATPAPVPAAPAPAPPTTAAATAPATDAAPAHVGFKDGTFVGYGRSNHGDVEATVDIVDGQIVDAYITKCLTEYSCSWIVALPPQVSQRQSAEVDIVSGATASSNAFYAAIKQALAKAK